VKRGSGRPGADEEAVLREMVEDARSEAVRQDWQRANAAQRAAAVTRTDGLMAALALASALRELFGDPPVDRTPWPERIYRL
jgi:hypothetical protein